MRLWRMVVARMDGLRMGLIPSGSRARFDKGSASTLPSKRDENSTASNG